MKPMKFRLTSTYDTWEEEAETWTQLFEKLRVLQLMALVKIERIDSGAYLTNSQ